MINTQSGLSVERETAIKILEAIAEKYGSEDMFDSSQGATCLKVEPDGTWYEYEDLVTSILLAGKEEAR